jgi:hypothetical protein
MGKPRRVQLWGATRDCPEQSRSLMGSCLVRVITARIDGQIFILSPDQDFQALKEEIVAAIRAGSDFVEFDTLGREKIFVLVTPNLPVRFETQERSEEQVEEWEHNPPPIDVSDYDDSFAEYPGL